MIAEILSTGDEIRTGALIDSNSAYIAERIEVSGIPVLRHTTVGDALSELVAVLKEIGSRADIAVVTGGLGPTEDDLTAEAAAEAAGVKCELDQTALVMIENFFHKFGRPMSASNRKQAFLPRGARRLDNTIGTAPGFLLKIARCHCFFLPGVPAEMKKMLSKEVLPQIMDFNSSHRTFCLVRTLSTFGLPESATGERLADLTNRFPEIKLGLRAKFPEIHVRLYAYGLQKDRMESMLEDASVWVSKQLGKKVISFDGRNMEEVVGALLSQANATLAVAESCTGGLIAHRLTNVPGSSNYFLLSSVTYANQAKSDVLDVSSHTIGQYGAVSEETAKEMAKGVRRLAGAEFGLSTSGVAGPDGGTKEKPVGTVCIALAFPEGVEARTYRYAFGSRAMHKMIFAQAAMDLLRRKLMEDSGSCASGSHL